MSWKTSIACLIVAIATGMFLCVFAQRRKAAVRPDAGPFLDLPSAPLRLEPPHDGDRAPDGSYPIAVTNRTTKAVTGYRLGCVTRVVDKIILYDDRPMKRVSIAPVKEVERERKGNLEQVLVHVPTHISIYPREKGCRGQQRLAVVEVEFADGASWKAPE